MRKLQPNAVMFSDAGPDVRWIGNESATGNATCWGQMDPARVPYPGFIDVGLAEALQMGDPTGSVWRPGEADVSIRPGWFWREAEDGKVRETANLTELYFGTVGRNSKLLLNVPPTREGLFHEKDVRVIEEFGRLRTRWFEQDLLQCARVRASSQARGHSPQAVLDEDIDSYWSAAEGAHAGWLEFELPAEIEFDTLRLREAISQGQHIATYRVEAWCKGAWRSVSWGTTIGCQKLDRFAAVRTKRLRLEIDFAYEAPRLATVSVHRSTGWQL